MPAGEFFTTGHLGLSAYCWAMQLSIFGAVLPDHTFPLWLAIPPPPSDTVTLQWTIGGSLATPIGEPVSGMACAQAAWS